MPSRRSFLAALPLIAASRVGSSIAAAPECAVYTPSRQKATRPDDALRLLKSGNERFVAGRTINCDLRAQVRETAGGQAPFAAILGCIDSRVPPELVFDQRIGDIFCARIAGNFVDTNIIGSLEFSTKVSGAPLIVVLGHSECGAIKGAVDGVKLGHLTALLRHFDPALDASKGVPGARNSKNKALVQAVAEANARIALKDLTRESDVLRDLVAAGDLRIVAAMHDIATGRVAFLA